MTKCIVYSRRLEDGKYPLSLFSCQICYLQTFFMSLLALFFFCYKRELLEFFESHFSSRGSTAPSGPGPPHYGGFTITLGHTTLGRTPLDEWSARCTDLYLTTHNTHMKHTSMPLAGFKPSIPALERPHTHTLGHATTGISQFTTR
jgi:hypothetical protein